MQIWGNLKINPIPINRMQIQSFWVWKCQKKFNKGIVCPYRTQQVSKTSPARISPPQFYVFIPHENIRKPEVGILRDISGDIKM